VDESGDNDVEPLDLTLAALLLEHTFADDAPLLCTIDRQVSAREAKQSARRVAGELVRSGVSRGHSVAVQLASGPDLVVCMVAIWIAGATFVPINVRQPEREVEHILRTIRPAAIIRESGTQLLADPLPYDSDVAFVTWTSGTTGPPKAILHTHSGYLELLDRVLSPLRGTQREPRRQDPTPNLVPVSAALNAGIYNVLFGLRAGAAVVLMERFTTSEFATLVRRYAIRSTVLPPAAMVMLTDDPDVSELSPLRYVRSITAPLSPLAAGRFMQKFHTTVLNSYGQAEVGEVIGWTASDAKEFPEKLGAAGRPHPGVQIKIVDEVGQTLSTGQVGELLVRPPRMAEGYVGGESLQDRMDQQNFVHTGDYASFDDAGFVWIEGRKTDLINRGGNKVFPAQVEEVILLVPGVREVAVVGAPDDRLGEVPVAFIVGDANDDSIEAVCRDHLVPYKIPVAFHRVEKLPRSEVGKVLRHQLLRLDL
jgi:acyl-CoA synthetase (AMP-forming)/AMP-acid ligase II